MGQLIQIIFFLKFQTLSLKLTSFLQIGNIVLDFKNIDINKIVEMFETHQSSLIFSLMTTARHLSFFLLITAGFQSLQPQPMQFCL